MTLAARPRLAILFVALAVLFLSLTGAPVQAQDGSVPDQPTGLSTEASHDRVNLTWDDPNDDSITHYQVLRRDRAVHDTGEFVTIESDTGSATTSYTDDSVEPEKRYVYRVKAVNQHGVSKWSKFARADTPAAPAPEPDPTPTPTPTPTPETDGDGEGGTDEGAPDGAVCSATGPCTTLDETDGVTHVETLELTNVTHDSVTLEWTAPEGDPPLGYVILRTEDGAAPTLSSVIVGNTESQETSHTDSGLAPETLYTYWVLALRWTGVSALKDAASASATTPPAPIVIVNEVLLVREEGTAYDEPGGPLKVALQSASGTGSSIVLTWSPPREETSDGLFTGPEVDVDGYLINVTTRLASAEQSTRQVADLGSTVRTWTHEDVEAGIWRRYSIRGHKNGEEGPAAYTDWVRIPQDGEPGSPSNLRLSLRTDPTEVRLNWTAGSDATGYKIYRRSSWHWNDVTLENELHKGVGLEAGNVTTYTDGDAGSVYRGTTHDEDNNPGTTQIIEGVLPGFTYTYVVEAVNASGTSERTAKASILIPTPGKPNAVRNFEHGTIRRGNGATTNIRLSWDAPQGFTTNSFGGTAGYVIERALDLAEHTERGLDWENLAKVSIGTHTYTDSAAVDAANADRIMPFGTTWRYRIRAVSGLDATKQSDNSYVDAAIPMPSGVPGLITDERINYGGSHATGYGTQTRNNDSWTCATVRWDVLDTGATDHRILRLGPGVTSWHDPDAVLVSSTTGLSTRSTTADITRLSGSGGFGGASVCDTTVEAGETYIYIVQARNSNGWNTQVVDEFNVIDTIAVIYIETGSDVPPPPTEVEVDEVLWSATLTVGRDGGRFGYSHSSESDFGTLDPRKFTIDGSEHAVDEISIIVSGSNTSNLRFWLDSSLSPGEYNLYLDGTPFPFTAPGGADSFFLSPAGLAAWTTDQEVEVRLGK